MARTTYTREFKLQAVCLMTNRGLSVAEVARPLGVGANCLRNWRAAAQQRGESAFPGRGNLSPAADELRCLRAAVQRLRAARNLLKKPPPTWPARRVDLPLHCRPLRRMAGGLGVQHPGSSGVRLSSSKNQC